MYGSHDKASQAQCQTISTLPRNIRTWRVYEGEGNKERELIMKIFADEVITTSADEQSRTGTQWPFVRLGSRAGSRGYGERKSTSSHSFTNGRTDTDDQAPTVHTKRENSKPTIPIPYPILTSLRRPPCGRPRERTHASRWGCTLLPWRDQPRRRRWCWASRSRTAWG